MRIVVTGGNGYIGRHVVQYAIDAGNEVIVSDLNYKNVDSRAKISEVDIFNNNSNIYYELGEPDIVLHLAWQDGFVHNSYRHMNNLSKHYIFLRNLAQGGCQNIAVMGTVHEIGYWEGAIDETTPCQPLSLYGVAKNALREAFMQLVQEFNFNPYWLRAFYIYGDDMFGSSIFSKIALAASQGKTEFPFTTGKNRYDFISVDELAKQIVLAVTQSTITGIINTCTGIAVSLAEQIESYIANHNYNMTLRYGEFPDRPYDSPAVWGDNSRIQQILQNAQKGD